MVQDLSRVWILKGLVTGSNPSCCSPQNSPAGTGTQQVTFPTDHLEILRVLYFAPIPLSPSPQQSCKHRDLVGDAHIILRQSGNNSCSQGAFQSTKGSGRRHTHLCLQSQVCGPQSWLQSLKQFWGSRQVPLIHSLEQVLPIREKSSVRSSLMG